MRTREESLKIISDAIGGNAYAANDINQNEQNTTSQQNTGMRSREESLRIIQSAMGGGSTAEASPQQTTPQSATPTAPLEQGSLAGGGGSAAGGGGGRGGRADTRADLQRQLNALDEAAAYATTTELSDAIEQQQRPIIEQLRQMDEEEGRTGVYTGGDRLKNLFSNARLATQQGVTRADHRRAQTADWLFGGLAKEGRALLNATLQSISPNWGFENEDPLITQYNKRGEEVIAHNEAVAQKRIEEGRLSPTAWKYAPEVVAAIPDAVLAYLTPGASSGAQATSAGLKAASASAQAGKAAQTIVPIANATKNMIKNPKWLNAFANAAGSSYEQAIAEGATEEEANLSALLNGFNNATIEVGGSDEALGGIENLPQQLRDALEKRNNTAVMQWIKSSLNEAGEEVAQGMTEKAMRGIYTNDVPLYSATDENAIINPTRAKEEALSGFVVSSILGGGQSLFQSAINGNRQSARSAQTAGQEQTGAETQAAEMADTVEASQSTPPTAPLTQGSQTPQTDVPTAPLSGEQLQEEQTQAAESAQDAQRATPQAETPPATENAAQAASDALNRQAETNAQEQGTATTQNAAPVASNQTTGQRERTEGADAVRGFSENVATDSAMEEALRREFEQNPEMYTRLANKDTLKKAQDIFTQGLDKARSELERAIGAAQSGQKFPPEMVPLSRMVANELTRQGELTSARKIISDVAAELTSAGQLGQAAAILRNADPVTVMDTLQKALDSINKEVSGKQGNSGKRKAADSTGAELENAVKDAAGKIAENEEIQNAVKREIRRSRSGKGKGGEKQEASMAEVLRDALKRDAFSRIKPKTTDPQKELVKSLKRFAMEKLPPKQGATRKTAADVLSDYVKNQEMFTEAWEDAQQMLRKDKEVKGNPIIEEILGGFVNEGINVNANYPAEIRGRIMAKALTEEALNTGETKQTIRNQYALGVSVKEIGGRISDSLIRQTGASGEIAETIRDAATEYADRIISEDTKDAEARANSIVNSAVLSVGETMRSLAKQGQTSKAAIKRAVADVLAFEYAVDPKTAERISETVYELYDAQLKESMDAEVQRRYGEKEPGRKKPLNESISEAINIGAFESEYAEKAADQLTKKAIKELGTTVEKIALGNSAEKSSIRDAVVSLFVSNYGLSQEQAHEIADVVTSQFDNMVSQAANKVIERRFGAKPGREAQKTDTVQKLIEAVNIGAFNSAYASEAANKLFGLDKIKAGNWKAELTAEEIKQISETDFSQDGAFEAIQQQIAERLGREMPATWLEKWRELRKVGMLANPKTQLKNLFGNAPLAVERKVSERLSGGIQELAVKAGIMAKEEQTRTLRVSQESKDLAKSVYKNNFDRITRKGNKGELRGILRDTRTYFNKGLLQKGIEKATGHQLNDAALDYVRRFTYDMLEKGDAPFVKSAFVDSLAQYCEAQGIKSEDAVTETAFSYALDQAMAATFKDASALANLLNSIKDNAGIAGQALDVLLPFTTTPINIAKEFSKYSPLGYLQLLNAKGKGTAEVIDIISRATTGSAVVAIGAILRSLGFITGAADDDKDKAAADKAAGISPYSFGGKYSYEWMQPTGSALAMGAEIYDSAKDGGSLIETISNGIISAGDAYLEQSFYKDIIDLFQGYGSPTENMIRELLTGTASQFIPTIVGATARTIDPTVRTSYSGGNIIDDILAQAKVKTPGISKSAPASVNVRGEEIQRGNLAQRILDNFIFPWTTNRNGEAANAVDKALDEVYEATGDKTIFRQVSPYKVDYGGESYQMTGEEREQFQKTQGQVHDDILQQIIDGGQWESLSNEEKAKIMNRVNEYALDSAKRELVEARGDDYSSDWDDEAELPDVGNYLAAKTTLKAAQESKDYTLLDALVGTVSEQQKAVQEKLNKDFSMLDELIYGKEHGVDAETIYTAKTEADANGNGKISQEELWYYLGLQKNMPEETKDVLWDILTTGKTGYSQYAEKQK